MFRVAGSGLTATAIGAALILTMWTMKEEAVSSPSVIDEVSGLVRYVVDGDSLYIEGYVPQIRLWGVDARDMPVSKWTLIGMGALWLVVS